MLNCEWAQALTRYDCRQVPRTHGGLALEIGTPFSLYDGSAVVLYILEEGSHVLISDNGDTLTSMSGMGLDVWHAARQKTIRERASLHGLTLSPEGDLRCLATPQHVPFVFAKAVAGVLAVGDWASEQLRAATVERDLVAEAEPFIIARNPALAVKRRPVVRGASHTDYKFDLQHGTDLIDVIGPSPQATGGVMRKAGDVQNGPFLQDLSPLVIVDDRHDPIRAHQEIAIIASVTRAMSFRDLVAASSARH